MKIYDCFTFYNELDLLEIRLHELSEKVDYFVIVEADKTFTGIQKEFLIEKNINRYKKFKNQIIYIKLNLPKFNSAWEAEYFQRNAIIKGLKNCKDEDIIMISDVDEIPKLINFSFITNNKNKIIPLLFKINTIFNYSDKLIQKYKKSFFSLKKAYNKIVSAFISKNNYITFRQDMFFYYLNLYDSKWMGTTITNYFNLKNLFNSKIQTIRDVKDNAKSIINGGWHFSYLGNVAQIQIKLNSYAHQEYNTKEYNNYQTLLNKINKNIHLTSNKKLKLKKVGKNWPKHILKNLKKYGQYIKV